MSFSPTVPAARPSSEQLGDFFGDAGNDGAIKDQRHSRQQKRAEHHGDDDPHPVGDIKITGVVGDSRLCADGGGMDAKGRGIDLVFQRRKKVFS